MKRILTYDELSPAMKRAAVEKIQRLAEGRARYCGEIWSEPSSVLAPLCRYSVLRHEGEITAIWDVKFPSPPKVLPGTEFRPFRKAA